MTDPYTWPEPPLLAAIRAQRDALLTGLAACIAYAERHDGRGPYGHPGVAAFIDRRDEHLRWIARGPR